MTTHLDQQLFLMNYVNAMMLPQSLKLYFQTICKRLAVELQPYGSKNLDGYRRAVGLPVEKT